MKITWSRQIVCLISRSDATRTLPVVIHDRVEPVSHSEHCTVLKLSPDCVLDQSICLQVHSCSCFIQNENSGFPEHSPGKAQQLSLSHTGMLNHECKDSKPLNLLNCRILLFPTGWKLFVAESSPHYVSPSCVSASFWLNHGQSVRIFSICSPQCFSALTTLVIQAIIQSIHKWFEMSQLQGPPDVIISLLAEWIQIPSESSWEDHWVLGLPKRFIWSICLLLRRKVSRFLGIIILACFLEPVSKFNVAERKISDPRRWMCSLTNFLFLCCLCENIMGVHASFHLWDNGEPGPEIMKSKFRDVDSIDGDVASCRLNDTEKSQSQRGFPSSSSAYNSHLLSWSHWTGEILEHQVQSRSVPCLVFLEFHSSILRPVHGWSSVFLVPSCLQCHRNNTFMERIFKTGHGWGWGAEKSRKISVYLSVPRWAPQSTPPLFLLTPYRSPTQLSRSPALATNLMSEKINRKAHVHAARNHEKRH